MTDELRWFAAPDAVLPARLRMPKPTVILFVAAVDVLAALERDDGPEALRNGIQMLLARRAEMDP